MSIITNNIPVFAATATVQETFTPPYQVSVGVKGYYFSDVVWNGSSNPLLTNGVIEGIARSVDYNTVLRQCSVMASALAQILGTRAFAAVGGSGWQYPGLSKSQGSSVFDTVLIGADLISGSEDTMAQHVSNLAGIFNSGSFLFDGEVVTSKINDGAVTTVKLENATGTSNGVTTAKIATDAVTQAKLGDDLIVTGGGSATANGITVSLSQGSTSGARGFKIGISGNKVTNAANADVATRSNTVSVQGKTGTTIYLLGSSSQLSNGTTNTGVTVFENPNVYVDGSNRLCAPSFNTASDERLKENIHNIGKNQVRALVEGVDVKTFNFKDDPNTTYAGVIAQDVLKAGTVIGDLFVDQGEDGFYSVRESKLVYLLWDYVKQLEKRVKALEEKLGE